MGVEVDDQFTRPGLGKTAEVTALCFRVETLDQDTGPGQGNPLQQ